MRRAALLMVALAAAWLAPLALAGFDEGAVAYERGDYETAHREFLKAAEQGDARAQYNLGVMYGKGEGVPQDYAEALRWYRQAAEQGDASAQFNLGVMYYRGEGVSRDYAEALRWWRQAAEQGHARAQNSLGVMYYEGEGVPQNFAEALRWWRQAAEQGHANAQLAIGSMYSGLIGLLFDFNSRGATQWVREEVGDDFAEAEAVRWYRRAAEQGHANAQYALGLMYHIVLKSDPVEAVRWYRRAAEQGHSGAQRALGEIYAGGKERGVLRDYMEAAHWYRQVAEQGDAVAQFNLGLMYHEGKGVPRDYVEAYKWFSIAAALLKPASQALDDLEARMTAAQVAEAQARARNWQPNPGAAPSNVSNAPEDRDHRPTSTGTGFLVNRAGHVLTNHHVVADCARVRTSLPGDDAKIRAHDATNDLALLAVQATDGMRPASFRAQQVRLGEEVMAVGYPLHGLVGQGLNVTRGEVSALSGIGGDSRHLQITAPVQPGNSGGPLLDRAGRVAGVVIGTLDAIGVAAQTGNIPQNVNYAIRSGVARAFLDAHAVSYNTSAKDRERPTEAIAEAARAHTVIIECWN